MKIKDIAKISEDKSDGQKISDLLRSGQDINTAVNTYRLMHAGNVDYDAAFSKVKDLEGGPEAGKPKDPRDNAQAKLDARAKDRQKDARGKADKQKNKGEFKRDVDRRKKKGIDSSDYTVDPKTGQMYAKQGSSFYGNQYTGSLGLGAVKGIRKYAKDPKQIIPDLLSLGSDDVESSIGRGAAAGAAIGKIKGAGRRKPKFSLRDS